MHGHLHVGVSKRYDRDAWDIAGKSIDEVVLKTTRGLGIQPPTLIDTFKNDVMRATRDEIARRPVLISNTPVDQVVFKIFPFLRRFLPGLDLALKLFRLRPIFEELRPGDAEEGERKFSRPAGDGCTDAGKRRPEATAVLSRTYRQNRPRRVGGIKMNDACLLKKYILHQICITKSVLSSFTTVRKYL